METFKRQKCNLFLLYITSIVTEGAYWPAKNKCQIFRCLKLSEIDEKLKLSEKLKLGEIDV